MQNEVNGTQLAWPLPKYLGWTNEPYQQGLGYGGGGCVGLAVGNFVSYLNVGYEQDVEEDINNKPNFMITWGSNLLGGWWR